MDKEKVKNFIVSQRANGVPDDQIFSFLQEKGAIPKQQEPVVEKPSVAEKIATFTGGKELAQGLGQAIAQPEISKGIEETQKMQTDIQTNLLTKIKEQKALGADTSRLENALALITEDLLATGEGAEKLLNQNELTGKQVIGSALQLGTTLAGTGSFAGVGTQAKAGMQALKSGENVLKAVKGATQAEKYGGVLGKVPLLTKGVPEIATGLTKGIGVGQGALQGLKTGIVSGAGLTGASSIAQGLREDLSGGEIAEKGLYGALFGGITGGILGTVTGGISGGIKSNKLRNQILDNQIKTGAKTTPITQEIKAKTTQLAKQQGILDEDISFIQSMKPVDRVTANKMVELAKKASTDKRILERPIDIVGDSMVKRIKFIESQNSTAGKKVNEVAKLLRGQAVDANAIAQRADDLIDDLGIIKTTEGKFDFSNSVFKNTPEIQKKLTKFLAEVPTGQADAYDVHIFKKSIDELVDYGTKGEGLKGNSERILKALRSSADGVLDNSFDAYNQANTDFRITKSVLDEARDLFGKKTGIGKERGGQLLRSVFSNNTQRPRVLKLVDALDSTSKHYGGKFKDSLVDQALFTEILEDIYGTQATTSLQGQVGRAVKGTQKVIEGVRNPIKGVGELLATGAEKSLGISSENKKKALQALLR